MSNASTQRDGAKQGGEKSGKCGKGAGELKKERTQKRHDNNFGEKKQTKKKTTTKKSRQAKREGKMETGEGGLGKMRLDEKKGDEHKNQGDTNPHPQKNTGSRKTNKDPKKKSNHERVSTTQGQRTEKPKKREGERGSWDTEEQDHEKRGANGRRDLN